MELVHEIESTTEELLRLVQKSRADLFKLIQTEIALATTFLSTHKLASSEEHRDQALGNAQSAVSTATRFLARLPDDEQTRAAHESLYQLARAIKERRTEVMPPIT